LNSNIFYNNTAQGSGEDGKLIHSTNDLFIYNNHMIENTSSNSHILINAKLIQGNGNNFVVNNDIFVVSYF